MRQKIAIRCSKCGGRNIVPQNEVMNRVDEDGTFVCWKHCKEFRWGSDFCAGCSDRVFCAGDAQRDWRNFVDENLVVLKEE